MKVYHLTVACLLASCAFSRKVLKPVYNPNCNGNPVCDNSNSTSNATNNLFLTESVSNTDKFFFIWSTIGAPTLLLLRTAPDANVSIDWNSTIKDTSDLLPLVKVGGELYASAGYVLTSLWNCSCEDPDAIRVRIPLEPISCPSTELNEISLGSMAWTKTDYTISPVPGNDNAYQFTLKSNDKIFRGGTLSIQITIYGDFGRDELLLAMLHSGNSTQFQVTLNDLPGSGLVRYSLEHTYTYPYIANDPFKYKSTRYLDDEYTPGIFSYEELDASTNSNTTGNADRFYFGWKTAGYKDTTLSLKDLVPLNLSPGIGDLPVERDNLLAEPSIVTQFYADRETTFSTTTFNMSFGENVLDGGYNHVLTWCGQFGFGYPRYDQLSGTVLGITIAGILIPILVIVVGGIGVYFMKKQRSAKFDMINGGEPVNNEFAYREINNEH